MAIEFTTAVNRGILYVIARGRDDSLADVEKYSQAIIGVAIESGCAKVICDETELVYSLSLVDTFQLAGFISEYAPGVGCAAVICNPDQISDASFWETVAVNRGLRVRVFRSLKEAEEWIEPQSGTG